MKRVTSIIFLFSLLVFLNNILSQTTDNTTKFSITLKNQETYPVTITIQKGDLYETISPKYNPQNLVVSEDVTITLQANEIRKIELKGYCTNREKNAPSGQSIRPTPLHMNPDHCNSQNEVWERIQSLRGN